MKAEEARKITHDHSKRMQEIYKNIKESAMRGNNETHFIGHTTHSEIQVLRDNGFDATYANDDTDGAQYVLIKW